MSTVEQVLWIGPVVALVVASGVVRRKAMARMDRRAGRRPDGSYPPGRRLEDMTPVAKAATGIAVPAFLATAVLRFADGQERWFWISCLVAMTAAGVVLVSEKRRARREGLEPLD